MKINTQNGERKLTPESALDRAVLEFPELTFESRKEATRVLNRVAVTLTVKHNSTVVYRGGAHIQGFVDGDEPFDRAVEAMMGQLLQRAAPDLAAWRLANPLPKPDPAPAEPIDSQSERETPSS